MNELALIILKSLIVGAQLLEETKGEVTQSQFDQHMAEMDQANAELAAAIEVARN